MSGRVNKKGNRRGVTPRVYAFAPKRMKFYQPIKEPCLKNKDEVGPFFQGYHYVLYAPLPQDREQCLDTLYAYLDDRAERDSNFQALVWSHFDDPHTCGAGCRRIGVDHYHLVTTRQLSKEENQIRTPGASAMGTWLRDYRVAIPKVLAGKMISNLKIPSGDWPKGPPGSSIDMPKLFFQEMTGVYYELTYYTCTVDEESFYKAPGYQVFKPGGKLYVYHRRLEEYETNPYWVYDF